MTTEQAAVNGISITFEDKGPRDAPAILLVMGLGGQLTLWPDEFVDALNARGSSEFIVSAAAAHASFIMVGDRSKAAFKIFKLDPKLSVAIG